MKVSSVQEMRSLDRDATEQYGIPETILMENAGEAAYAVIAGDVGDVCDKKFVVFCGVGNNGGDGLVVARKILSDGGTVKVFIIGDPAKFGGAAKINFEMAARLPFEILTINSPDAIRAPALRAEVAHADAVIDAIFGTGLTREVSGLYGDAIRLINEKARLVFSLDIPSGIDGDRGTVLGEAVRADATITFGLPKRGNLLYPGCEYGGELYVAHISFPPALQDRDDLKVAINSPLPLPPRSREGHKGDFGKVLFIAGAASYIGAPYFAAYSFLKAGGGYARLATPASIATQIAAKGSEIVLIPQKETKAGSIAKNNKAALLSLASEMDFVVLGPGLSLDEETQTLVRELTAKIERPLLIDGDGLTAISADLKVLKKRKFATILTPHTGEMTRLTKKNVAEIGRDKIDILQKTAGKLNALIVLKGAHSLIGYPDGRVFINLSGNPGMAKAGTGDVLTGAIAAMNGLGLDVPDAVCMGVFLHGFAGDLAAEEMGEDGISAQNILEFLPAAVKKLREEMQDPGPYSGCGPALI
jgi:NAD(P)H-hydrate epimerase